MVHGNEVKAVDGVNTCSGEIESLRAERDALALRVANLERIGREIVDVADQEKLPAFSCFQDMNDALKSTGTGTGLREIVERAVRAGSDEWATATDDISDEAIAAIADRVLSGRPAERDAGDERAPDESYKDETPQGVARSDPSGGITGHQREHLAAQVAASVGGQRSLVQPASGPAPALPSSSSDLERARAWLEANTRHMGFYEPAIASLANLIAAIRRDASATNAAERAVVEAADEIRRYGLNWLAGERLLPEHAATFNKIAAAARSLAGRDARET